MILIKLFSVGNKVIILEITKKFISVFKENLMREEHVGSS